MRTARLLALATLALALVHAAATLRLMEGLSGVAWAANAALLGVEVLLCAFAALLLASLRAPSLPPAAAPGAAPAGPVDVLVPVRNEDARVLRATLEAALRMEAPRGGFGVVVADDSDPEGRGEVERTCRALGVGYHARAERRGYKAGALNDALARVRAPYVAVLDVDHQPEPRFLAEALARFAPGVAYVQTVVEWRNDDSLLRRLAALLQHQFYYGVQMEKGARERAVFTGSAALFRREALDEVGGFPEDTLVEDFDLSLRLANAGWRGRLAPVVGARGLLPWSAQDLARQLWRWSAGTTEVVRLRLGETLRSRRAPLAVRLELLADGCAYLAGGLVVAAALLLAIMGFAGLPVARPLAGWAILLAPVAVAAAHMASAWLALRLRGGPRSDARLLPLYHAVSLAFTPVLLASSLAAASGLGRRFEGRVGKSRQGASRARGVVPAIAGAVLLGAAALAAAWGGWLPVPAAGWVGLLGASFACTVVAAWPRAARAQEA